MYLSSGLHVRFVILLPVSSYLMRFLYCYHFYLGQLESFLNVLTLLLHEMGSFNIQKRKRGLFSCDRCKVKKIGCYRPNGENIDDPCVTCQVLKVDCCTTIKRKKRKPSIEPIPPANQELMIRIVKNLYPNVNCYDVSELTKLYNSMDHSTEDRNSDYDSDCAQTFNYKSTPSYIVYSGKSINGLVSTESSFGLDQNAYDRVIYDNEGVTHYVGSFGFTSSLTILINNLIRFTQQRDLYSIRFIKNMNKRGSIISSFAETIAPDVFKTSRSDKFPLVCYFSQEESDFYVDRFFHYSNCLLRGITRSSFRLIYEKLWRIHSGNLAPSALSSAQYCCIYTVWIIGVSNELYPDASMQVTYELMNKYINLIKVLLSDVYLVPTPDGILSMLLLSSFFEINMQIETAYILSQTAVCQAMSCGLHRESISTDDTAYLWWSLFDKEIKLGLYLGRPSSIPLRQVNLDHETRFLESTYKNLDCNLLMSNLNRIAYSFLCNRSKLPISGRLLTDEHINSAIHIKELYNDFYNTLSLAFKDFHNINASKAEVMLNFYFCYVSSTLPFVLFPWADMPKMDTQIEKLIKLVDSCIDAAIKAVELIKACDESNFRDSLEALEASLSTYVMVAFVGGVLFFKDEIMRSRDDTKCDEILPIILSYSSKLREYNQLRISTSRGTLRIRRYWVEILNDDLGLLFYGSNTFRNERLQKAILGDFEVSVDMRRDSKTDKDFMEYPSINQSGLQMNSSTQYNAKIEDIFDQFFAKEMVHPDM